MTAPYKAHPTSVISDKARIGAGTRIWHHAQVREGAEIGENCVLGKSVYVGVDVRIGSRVKVENRASIFKGVTIEDDVFVGPHVAFTNDLYPRAFSEGWEVVPTTVKRGASLGANSTIICGITIGEFAMVGAGSVVTRPVPSHALVLGNPARLAGYVCKCGQPIVGREEAQMIKPGLTIACERCGAENLVTPSWISTREFGKG